MTTETTEEHGEVWQAILYMTNGLTREQTRHERAEAWLLETIDVASDWFVLALIAVLSPVLIVLRAFVKMAAMAWEA